MPTSFTGLLIFIMFILPGLTYVARRELGTPEVRRSVFRETAATAAASVIFNIFALVLLGTIWTIWPDQTLDLDALVRGGEAYARDHYVAMFAWLVCTLVVAGGLAYWGGRRVARRTPHQSKQSAWWMLFDTYPRRTTQLGWVHVLCVLEDGSWIGGRLDSFSTAAADIEDRDLVLVPPIERSWSADDQMESVETGAVCISARRISSMFVAYMLLEGDGGEITTSTSAEEQVSESASSAASGHTESPPSSDLR